MASSSSSMMMAMPPTPTPPSERQHQLCRRRHQQHVIHHQRFNAIMDWPQELMRHGSFGEDTSSSSSSVCDEVLDVFHSSMIPPPRSPTPLCCYYYDSSPTTTYMKRPSKKSRVLQWKDKNGYTRKHICTFFWRHSTTWMNAKKSIKSTNKLFSLFETSISFPTKPTRCHCHVTYCTEKKRKALNDITKTRGKEQKITVVWCSQRDG